MAGYRENFTFMFTGCLPNGLVGWAPCTSSDTYLRFGGKSIVCLQADWPLFVFDVTSQNLWKLQILRQFLQPFFQVQNKCRFVLSQLSQTSPVYVGFICGEAAMLGAATGDPVFTKYCGLSREKAATIDGGLSPWRSLFKCFFSFRKVAKSDY